MRVIVIHNPDAGDEKQPTGDQIVRLIRKAGHKVKYQSSKDKKWKKALKKPCDIIAVAGGDGIIGKVARRLITYRIPIAVLPMGTANNIANTLGVTGKSFEDLVDGWQTARCTNFDAGIAKGPWGSRYFIEGFGVGLFAETMFKIENGHHPHVTRSADPEDSLSEALKALKKQLSSYPSKELTVRLDGQDLSGDYYMLEAMNIRFIGPNLDLVPGAEINDGLLDVVFVPKDQQAKLSQYIGDRLRGKRSRARLKVRQGRHLQVEWASSPIHLDDRPWPQDENTCPVLSNAIDIKIDPGALVFLKLK
ncbi:MAG TPA: diacylglycerol kinase family protein [Candidatus Binatia bacterium]